jgi:hypothetical protein
MSFDFRPLMADRDLRWLLFGEHMEAHRDFVGKYARIPIRLSPEARARRDWDDAVNWLREREEARREWPWPER